MRLAVQLRCSYNTLSIDAETIDGETRITSVGRTNRGRFLVVITTIRGAILRVVTAFPAPRDLIDFYVIHRGR